MWCTFASQQLKLKRQLFSSYHLFSAICPPLSGTLPGNISPGFYITYVPLTGNGLCETNHWSAGVKISVLIWIWMKRRINKWPWSSSPNAKKRSAAQVQARPWTGPPGFVRYESPFTSITLCFCSVLPSICSVCHLLLQTNCTSWQLRRHRLAKGCFLMFTHSQDDGCRKEAVMSRDKDIKTSGLWTKHVKNRGKKTKTDRSICPKVTHGRLTASAGALKLVQKHQKKDFHERFYTVYIIMFYELELNQFSISRWVTRIISASNLPDMI